jgi:hypothetical protein
LLTVGSGHLVWLVGFRRPVVLWRFVLTRGSWRLRRMRSGQGPDSVTSYRKVNNWFRGVFSDNINGKNKAPGCASERCLQRWLWRLSCA